MKLLHVQLIPEFIPQLIFQLTTHSVHSNTNNSIIFNSSQNQPQIPVTNPLVRINHAEQYNPTINNSQNNQNQASVQKTSILPIQ